MGFLDKVKSAFATEAQDDALWLYVQCDRCGSVVPVRIDRRTELNRDYEQGGYVLFKEVMDSKCFQLIHTETRFDEEMRVVSQAADHGKMLTREEYERMTQ
jgi:hypothetical protein